jgi:hypothetical protein
MTMSFTNANWFTAKPAQPTFKSVRAVQFKSRRTKPADIETVKAFVSDPVAKATPVAQSVDLVSEENTFEEASIDTWYDDKTSFEMFLDVVWARRNILGSLRSRKSYYNALKWQTLGSLAIFPPIGAIILLLNICFGLQAKPTRVAFIASCALAAIVLASTAFTNDPMTFAALR